MTLKIAERGLVSPFFAMDFMRAAARREASGAHVFHLEIGQPSSGLPEATLYEMSAFIREHPMTYTDAAGTDELREAIAHMYDEVYGIKVEPARIFLTTGSSGGFVLSVLAAFEPGDRVGLAVPGYPAYRNILTSLGCEPVPIPVGASSDFRLTADVVEKIDPPLEGLIVASPANPTGAVIPAAELRALARLCDTRGIRIVSDEIYHGLVYDAPAMTMAGMSGNAIVVNSFSKFYCMTGWRLGWLVLPVDLIRPVECLAQNLFISPPAVSQYAALSALRHRRQLEDNLIRYRHNRDILRDGLRKAGITRFAPADGAFYLYADVSNLTGDSRHFCESLLAETGVATTPGVDFDQTGGDRFVRFSFCGPTTDVEEAVQRIVDWVA